MNDLNKEDQVTIRLGKQEALLLFEFLANFYDQPVLRLKDNAERLALVRLHGALESTLVEPFSKEYQVLVEAARSRLIKEWGTAEG